PLSVTRRAGEQPRVRLVVEHRERQEGKVDQERRERRRPRLVALPARCEEESRALELRLDLRRVEGRERQGFDGRGRLEGPPGPPCANVDRTGVDERGPGDRHGFRTPFATAIVGFVLESLALPSTFLEEDLEVLRPRAATRPREDSSPDLVEAARE